MRQTQTLFPTSSGCRKPPPERENRSLKFFTPGNSASNGFEHLKLDCSFFATTSHTQPDTSTGYLDGLIIGLGFGVSTSCALFLKAGVEPKTLGIFASTCHEMLFDRGRSTFLDGILATVFSG
jgi:hypothetical protein